MSPLAVWGALSTYHLCIVSVLSLEHAWLDLVGFCLVRLCPSESIFVGCASPEVSSGQDGG